MERVVNFCFNLAFLDENSKIMKAENFGKTEDHQHLSVPQWWHSVVLVVLDSIQNVTIWIQMANSQGVKLVTNSCYLFCLVVKAAMCCGLVLIDPFSRDLVWGIYEILSAFTLTRISGMSFKKLGLFKGQMYCIVDRRYSSEC